MKFVRLNLLPNSDLKEKLLECANTYKSNGFVLSIVGDLSRAAFNALIEKI